MKAIDTNYKGYLFRSRLEARWAVFFDILGINWEYEKEGFELESGEKYLPDYWLPDLQIWIEIKAATPLEREYSLAEQLFHEAVSPVAIVFGVPGSHHIHLFCADATGSSGGEMWWEECEFTPSDKGWSIGTGNSFTQREFLNSKWEVAENVVSEIRYSPLIELAVTAARSARFEHGKSGAPL